ncbi:MAG: PD-(D/E)XK motif protein, partial [Candidatus Fermentibacteria bacterium]
MIYEELNRIWNEMESRAAESGSYDGLLRQRIPGKWSYEYFVGLSVPAKERFFYFSVEADFLPLPEDFSVTRGFRAERVQFPGASRPCILLRLLDASFEDVFTSLVMDLVDQMNDASTQRGRVKTFLNRLRRWQYFMKGYREEGLSPEAQRGLYGELHFFETVLFHRHGAEILQAWTGPERAHQDFQFNTCAVEVKTSIQKEPQVIT